MLFGVDWLVGLLVYWLVVCLVGCLVNQSVSLEARDNLVIFEGMMLLHDTLFCYTLYLP